MPSPLILHPLPALSDNYIWTLHNTHSAWVVDPGAAAPVLQWLQHEGLTLQGILLTHHHPDHTAGVLELCQYSATPAWGPANETLPAGVCGLQAGDALEVLGHTAQVIDAAGHTAGHVAYFLPQTQPAPWLLCGDALFSAGCGRLFEGTAAQMLQSLDRLAALPDSTLVCCAHEYTLSNLRFAQAVEPHNPAIQAHLHWCTDRRAAQLPTLPSTLALERQINPFLRSREPSVRLAIQVHEAPADHDDAHWFAALRRWKDRFS